jgi:hypothetical protein
MRYRIALVVALGLQLSLNGCALVPDKVLERVSEPRQVENLLAFYHRLSTATLDAQRKEHLDAVAANDHAPDDGTKLRLALTLLLPGVPWRDDARVAQLLGTVDTATGDQASSRHDFVALLEKMLQLRREEQKRCDQKTDALREDKRKLEQRLEASREECKKAEVLQQKLDELRDIDRDLRSKRPSGRTKP